MTRSGDLSATISLGGLSFDIINGVATIGDASINIQDGSVTVGDATFNLSEGNVSYGDFSITATDGDFELSGIDAEGNEVNMGTISEIADGFVEEFEPEVEQQRQRADDGDD